MQEARGADLRGTVVVVGSAAIDEQVAPDGITRLQFGGVVTYGGATLVREGLRAIAVCNLDDRDVTAGAVRAGLAALGVEVCAGRSASMTRFENRLLAHGGRRQQILGMADAIDAALVVRAIEALGAGAAPHVHLGPLHGADISGAALEVIAARARVVTLDVQGLVRRGALGPVHAEPTPQLEAALRAAQIVKADEAELEVVLRAFGVTAEQLVDRFEADELVVTAGSAGGYVVGRSGERAVYRAVIPAHEAGTTGAGDVFFAAYLAARLHRGASVAEACAHAAAVAGRHVGGEVVRAADLALPEGGQARG